MGAPARDEVTIVHRRIHREQLVALRHERGLSIEAAAGAIGISPRTLARYENGEVATLAVGLDRVSKVRNLRDIAAYYGLPSWQDLLGPVEVPAPTVTAVPLDTAAILAVLDHARDHVSSEQAVVIDRLRVAVQRGDGILLLVAGRGVA